MELTSRLGEYGSVGAGGADWATESEMKARAVNRLEISFFIIVLGPDLYFDLNYSEMSPKSGTILIIKQHFANHLCVLRAVAVNPSVFRSLP
jgi:hypothetical protein